MNCCVCGRKGPEKSMVVITISDEEKATIKTMGVEPKDAYVYCNPCMSILKNREAGARLIQGALRNDLKAAGHPSPEDASSKVYERLVQGRRAR